MFVTHLPTLTHLSHTYVSVVLSHIFTFSRAFFQPGSMLPVGWPTYCLNRVICIYLCCVLSSHQLVHGIGAALCPLFAGWSDEGWDHEEGWTDGDQ